MLRLIIPLIVMLICLNGCAGTRAVERATIPITGAFLQVGAGHSDWTAEDWSKELEWMSAAGMDTAIIQYAMSGRNCYYKSSEFSAQCDIEFDAVAMILDAAARQEINVFLGLSIVDEWWKLTAEQNATRNRAVMRELWERFGGHSAFVGWYIPEELENVGFNTPEGKQAAKEYLAAIIAEADTHGDRPVMVAPYFGVKPDGAAWAAWWDEVLTAAPPDIVAVQDGVGTHRTTAAESAEVYAALKPVMEKHGVALWADVEVFDQTQGWPLDDQGFAAIPAHYDRVVRQLELVTPHVEKVVIFDFPHYMSPRLGGRGAKLYEEYVEGMMTAPRSDPN